MISTLVVPHGVKSLTRSIMSFNELSEKRYCMYTEEARREWLEGEGSANGFEGPSSPRRFCLLSEAVLVRRRGVRPPVVALPLLMYADWFGLRDVGEDEMGEVAPGEVARV